MKNSIFSRRLPASAILSKLLPSSSCLPTFDNLRFHDFYSTSTYKQVSDPSPPLKILGLGIRFAPRPAEPSSLSYKIGFNRLERDIIIATTDFSGFDSALQYNRKIRFRSNWMPDIVNPYAMDLCEVAAHAVKSLIRNRKFPFSPSSNLYKQFRSLRSIASLKIVQSDKNSGLVAMHVMHYDDMVHTHLSNRDVYEPHESLDSEHWLTLLARVQRDHITLLAAVSRIRNQLPKNSIEFLHKSGSTLPVFHCLPKLHKSGMPGRPIIGSPSWLTTNWSILLDCLLEPVHVQFALKNSIHLVSDLENFHVEGSFLLCSADVASLYTNMSLDRLYDVISQETRSPVHSTILKYICENNFFRYGDQVFRQRDGIAMGTNCAVICANIYMDAFDKHFAPKCVFYRRYIDDIFFVLDSAVYDPVIIQQEMNSFIPKICLEFSLSIFCQLFRSRYL